MRLQKRARKRSTRSFLLLELLVAITLVTICLFPLLEMQSGIHQGERKRLEALTLSHQSHLAFAELKKLLYTNAIPWDVLSKGCQEKPFFTFGDRYTCHYALTHLEKYNKKSQGIIYFLLQAEITFYQGKQKVGEPHHFTFLAQQHANREKR